MLRKAAVDTPELATGTIGGPRREEIVCVTRGEVVEVFRVRLTEGRGASLDRFENGEFVRVRELSGALDSAENSLGPDGDDSGEPLERAIRRALRYLDGSVTVGERDLLSPTSALTRNLRWFPGDLQMLGTSFHYVRELFPSAQFHVTQLFRRVFGDVAFLSLIVFSSACWLRTRADSHLATLALVLQLASMVAIIGFDRFWEPIRYRWRKIREVRAPNEGRATALRLVGIVASQVVQGLAAVTINTLIGLTNLVINPVKIFQSYQKVRRGKTLEWKASSVSAGQDMRGWPVADFLRAYGGAAQIGLVMLAVLGWLVLLGAPLDLFGLNSVGIFIASFLTAWFFAWYSALPHAAETGIPQYELTNREFWGLTLLGAGGVAISVVLLALGLYPMPAFEPSTGVLALFLSATAAFIAVFPSYYRVKRQLSLAEGLSGKRPKRAWRGLVLALAACALAACALFAVPSVRTRAHHFFVRDPSRFRIPAVERAVYASVGAALKRTRHVEPEPLLSADGTQVTLSQTQEGRVLNVRELVGVPSPRPKRVAPRDVRPLPELFALPPAARIPINKPRRDFVLATAKPRVPAPPAHAEHIEAVLEGRRRARDMAPRQLSETELAEQSKFLAGAAFPWVSRDELEKLALPAEDGARLPLIEMARVYHFDEIKALWDKVPAASDDAPTPRARFARLLDGIDGASSLGLEPTAEHVQAFVAREREVAERWPREFPKVPLGALRERVAGTPSGAFQVARHELLYGLSFDDVARRLRLDYVNAAWNRPPIAPQLRRVFGDRIDVEQPDRLELDWDDNEEARLRFRGIQTEQLVASKLFAAALSTKLPSLEELDTALVLVEKALAPANAAKSSGLPAALSRIFQVEGLAGDSAKPDASTELLRARLWAQTMSGRIGQIAARVASNANLPGDEAQQALLTEVSTLRYPNDSADSAERRALDWLVLVDASETYRELTDGYARFRRELSERGVTLSGLNQPPELAPAQQWHDLFWVWQNLAAKYPNIPVRADLVAEFICHTAYFSSPDGKRGRTPQEFVDDFARVFASVDSLMGEAPPAVVQELTDAASLKTQGRLSRSAEARRFFAWWNVAALTRAVQYALTRSGSEQTVEPSSLSHDWAEIASTGLSRWPHLPWRTPGFSEYFVSVERVGGLTPSALWRRFEAQLTRAEAMSVRHVTPTPAFEALVEQRVSEKTGTPNFDPVTRRGNAVLALAELARVAAKNGVRVDEAHPEKLGRALAHLHEQVTRAYPSLYWDAEGLIESYLMLSLVNGWDESRTLREFDAEWSLANTFARHGLLARFSELASKEPSKLSASERPVREFIETQALRLQKKAGVGSQSVRARSMNALLALASLTLGAGEEGLLPLQQRSSWSKERMRAWTKSPHAAELDAATTSWALGLARDFGELTARMRANAPHFPWEDGSFVETELLVARASDVSLKELEAGRGPTWRVANELAERRVKLPNEFVQLVATDSSEELRERLAAVRNVSPEAISRAELSALQEPEVMPQTALLVLADVLAHIRLAHASELDAAELARKIVDVRKEGPRRYPNVPWSAKGFVTSLVVAAARPDFAGDVWRYAEFIALPAVDRLLAEAERSQAGDAGAAAGGHVLPPAVLADMRTIMTQQTGRSPSSERVVAFQALRDGLFLAKEFVPEAPPTLAASVALVEVRARVRALAERYPALHIVASDDQSPRIGFADRLAAIATKQALRTGHSLQDPAFAERATRLLESKFLTSVDRIYSLVRDSFPEEELAYYKEAIARDAVIDNERRAKQSGLSPESLSVPQVSDDDVVADFALYELLYAQEIGQQPAYVADLFEIYDKLRARPEVRADYRAGLAALDAEAKRQRSAYADEATWRRAPAFAALWQKRGDFVKQSRGKLIALSRTFALLKQAAFSADSEPAARAAFARFGSFDAFLSRFFDNVMLVRQTPEFKAALTSLAQRDPFLADGVEFAIAEFKLHVIDRLHPSRAESADIMRRIAEFLPKVNEDYRLALGLVPGLESGVPFYDAFSSYERADIAGAKGTDLLRRLNMVQRGLQSWTRTYFLKQAYKVLFDRDLDEEDPTELPSSTVFRRRTVGDEVKDFLETRLPDRLTEETGSRDVVVWIEWLMNHGELGLDGAVLGKNPYAEAVAGYERRLADYRARIESAEAKGKNARAERQRVLDIQREYGSLRGQVDALEAAARHSSSLYLAASRDYYDALRQSALWVLGLAIAWGIGRFVAHRLGPTRRLARFLPAACVAVPLALVALPFWVVGNASHAAAWAAPALQSARLLQAQEGEPPEPRGAAAQLQKTRPWTLFSADDTARSR